MLENVKTGLIHICLFSRKDTCIKIQCIKPNFRMRIIKGVQLIDSYVNQAIQFSHYSTNEHINRQRSF